MDGVTQLDLEVIGKLRCDANLRYLYEGEQKRLGAPRKYASKVDLGELSRWQALGTVEPDVHLFTAIVWSVSLKRKLRVVYLLNQKNPAHLCYALLFSTDVDLNAIALNSHSAVTSRHSGDRQELAAIALLLELLMQCSIYRSPLTAA